MTSIILFPSRLRTGHARRVATQLARARSNREADHILSRAIRSHTQQMKSVGIVDREIERQRTEFLMTIHVECRNVGAGWLPALEVGGPRGAA
ncbi:DUF6074 family protein [Sinorhizobium meliloti]|uniref:DUF6074 family protein n=1 Tax=Rhizobium meliloti TaxID=382 RepID=UPI003B9693A9